MPLRFTETKGGAGNDSFNFDFPFQIAFGLDGADTFSINTGTDFSVAMGGPGNDTYRGASNSALTVFDTSGGNDTIVADSVGLNKTTSVAVTIDGGKHLAFGDTQSGETIYILNWQQQDTSIENIVLENTTVSTDFVSNNRSALISGDFTWQEIGDTIGTTNPTSAQVNEALTHYRDQEQTLLNEDSNGGDGSNAPERTSTPNILVLSGERQTVDIISPTDVRGTAAAETVRVQSGADVEFASGEGDRIEFAQDLSAYSFDGAGNVLNVSREDGATAEIALNAATELAFADGTATASLNSGAGGVNITVGGEPVDGFFNSDDANLDAGDVSSLANMSTLDDGGIG